VSTERTAESHLVVVETGGASRAWSVSAQVAVEVAISTAYERMRDKRDVLVVRSQIFHAA
jgi:hypothetical protein